MITKTLALKTNSSNTLIVAFDVGKSSLDFYFEIPNPITSTFEASTGITPNKPEDIVATLSQLSAIATSNGFTNLLVTCESTGVYSEKLLRLARQQGHQTAYVSGESVHKLKVLENNDSGKTDTKDPRVILMIAKMDKTLRHRPISGAYLALRELNRAYDEEKQLMSSLKCKISSVLTRLFCDLDLYTQLIYKVTGKALYELFRFNPYRIVEKGQVQFVKMMRKHQRGIHGETLEKIWKSACTSSLLILEDGYIAAMEYRLEGIWDKMKVAELRMNEIESKMELLYKELLHNGEKVPLVGVGFLSAFRIGRILGETGPLNDFPNIEALMKYAGLNLKERRSGKYIGKVHLSKKGRSSLRKVLGEISFGMVKKTSVYGDYYHYKKGKGMNGTKILVAVERKLLKTFYTLGMKCVAFDASRLGQCESQLKKAA